MTIDKPNLDQSEKTDKKTWKARRTIPVDLEYLKTLSLKDRIYYLALRGWRIEMEERNGNDYLYAIRYIERRKKRIYLGKSEL